MRDIDRVIEHVQAALPDVRWEQLKVTHPADDDGIWYFSVPGVKGEIHVESSTGMVPFDLGSGRRSVDCASVESTVDTIVAWLKELR